MGINVKKEGCGGKESSFNLLGLYATNLCNHLPTTGIIYRNLFFVKCREEKEREVDTSDKDHAREEAADWQKESLPLTFSAL